jgi:hypothetical protein
MATCVSPKTGVRRPRLMARAARSCGMESFGSTALLAPAGRTPRPTALLAPAQARRPFLPTALPAQANPPRAAAVTRLVLADACTLRARATGTTRPPNRYAFCSVAVPPVHVPCSLLLRARRGALRRHHLFGPKGHVPLGLALRPVFKMPAIDGFGNSCWRHFPQAVMWARCLRRAHV